MPIIPPSLPAIRLLACSALALALTGTAGAKSAAGSADLILTGGRVYTVESAQPWAEAVAIKDGRILAVGSAKDIAKRKGATTRVVDLKGKLLLPAFGDAHNHPIFGGMSYARCSLHKGHSIEDYRAIITKCLADTPGDGTIFGVGWEDGLFPPNGVPRKEVLDAISTTRPMIFRSVGGHSLWLNSRALAMLNITKDTKAPTNGVIDKDPRTGEPVGGLQEAAQGLAEPLIPKETAADREAAITYTVKHFNSIGITSWHDAGIDWKDGRSDILDAYKAVRDRGALTVDVVIDLIWDRTRGVEQIPDILAVSQNASAMGLTAKSVKYYLDGVIPQHTAAMLAPYEGSTDIGSTQIPAATLNEAIATLDAKGIQAHIHAIGDGAVREGLNAFETARKRNGMSDTRPMMSHLNIVDPADQPRFGQLRAAAIFQPLWACDEPYMRLTQDNIGPKRSTYIYPENSIRKGGGMLAYGADWSVASANPLEGIEVALTRIAPGNTTSRPLLASEAVTIEEAVKAYTLNVAYVNHLDKEIGSIKAGKRADLVVLDQDIFKIAPTQISKTQVLVTLFNGREVFGSLAEMKPGEIVAVREPLNLAMGEEFHEAMHGH